MDDLSPKERLARAMGGQSVDRRPVICPGGMMNAAVVEVQEESGHMLPAAHLDAGGMAALAADVRRLTGFENFGAPYCMTVEPEALGSETDLGSAACEPKIAREAFADASSVERRGIQAMLRSGRAPVVAEAIAKLSKLDADVPVIGSVTGPVSAAASIVDPMPFLKGLRKDRAGSHAVMDYVTEFLVAYAGMLIEAGADVISIADPTATGEILGPKMFAEYAVPYINRVADAARAHGAKAIVHICGDMGAVWGLIPGFHADAVSTDAMVSLRRLKAEFPDVATMGNLSTYVLESASPESIAGRTQRLLAAGGIDIAAPACGLSTASPIENLRAFTGAAINHHSKT